MTSRKGKVISVSMSESLNWYLGQLSAMTGVPRSGLLVRGLLMVAAEYNKCGGLPGYETAAYELAAIEKEYKRRSHD